MIFIIISYRKMNIKQKNQMDIYFEDSEKSSNEVPIIIGYYNLRGKAQASRLICEYLGVNYKDKLFTLTEWQQFKSKQTKHWSFPDLPFVQEGHFIVTQSVPMCQYIIRRFGQSDLLGKTPKDKSIMQMYLWTIEAMANVISINCQPKSEQELRRFKQNQWNINVYPRLLKYEEAALENNFFLGYLSIIDFSIYELMNYMANIFPNKCGNLKRLANITQLVGNLEQIKRYQQSERCIRQWCPTKLLEELKRNMQKSKIEKMDSEKNSKPAPSSQRNKKQVRDSNTLK